MKPGFSFRGLDALDALKDESGKDALSHLEELPTEGKAQVAVVYPSCKYDQRHEECLTLG